MSDRFDSVTVVKKANVYFDGKCVSQNFSVAGNSSCDIETVEMLDSVCHFG
jgi:uncharacterized protein YaiE (UPF0345 family)